MTDNAVTGKKGGFTKASNELFRCKQTEYPFDVIYSFSAQRVGELKHIKIKEYVRTFRQFTEHLRPANSSAIQSLIFVPSKTGVPIAWDYR